MGQTRLHVTTDAAGSDRLFMALEAAFEDDGLPISVFDLDEANGVKEVSLYADDGVDDIERRMRAVMQGIGLTAAVEREVLPDIDWVAKSLEGLQPVHAGRFLVHGSHDRHRRRPGDLAIEIEAGLAFGTGHHGTTAGCLEMIETVVRREKPRNALDLGTGSAVLAIALARLAHIPVLATDIDPIATRVAADNARLNGVSRYVDARTAVGFQAAIFGQRAPFDLIVANILARPLMKMAPDMARFLGGGRSLILSGILERQRDAVIAAYVGQGFRHIRTLWRGEWVTLHLKR
ncbi:50S ribosomal protein L11 methyltransferase [Mesorhizobium marinum]|uniref:Ribosomal protein L11 methyltransferase n=1 Tax=Mesorhizobium marinum TaxID=3228790 RepID=A0ABV3QV48_9HYPH